MAYLSTNAIMVYFEEFTSQMRLYVKKYLYKIKVSQCICG